MYLLVTSKISKLCEKSPFSDITYKTSGVFTKKYKTANGCDSVIITNLIVNPVKKKIETFVFVTY